jgi:putative DNA primase/helicase
MPFKGKDVFVAYDADAPGQKYAGFAAQALAGTAKSVRMIQWPSFMGIDENGAYPGDHGQDLTDFFVTHGKTPADLQALINTAASPGDSPAPLSDSASPDILQFFEYGINKRFSFKPRLLAEKLASEAMLLSDPGTGLVYRWNDKYWELFDEDHIRSAAILYLGNESQKSRVEDAVYQVKMLATISHGRAVNDREDWINLQNGMLNIYTFEMRPHDPEFYFINIVPVVFDPKSQKRCERFEQYLSTNIVTPEVIAQLQEFTGYCLVRHANYEKCVFLLGPGADGKSRYMKILRALVGPENCSAVSFGDIEDHFQRSALYNKMVNLSAEVGSNMIESEYFKKITSGDTINAAFKHKDAFDFNPYCKLVFAGNILPRVRDNSDGFFRRILPIQFKRQFKEGDPDRDPELLEKFRAEISEIFFWALCGLKRLVEQKRFTDCKETRDLLMGYRRSNNPILCFVEDECSLGDELEVAKADLYNAYRKYCGENGYVPVSRETFFRELYAAIQNLRLYRPRLDGERISVIQGIKVNFKMDG